MNYLGSSSHTTHDRRRALEASYRADIGWHLKQKKKLSFIIRTVGAPPSTIISILFFFFVLLSFHEEKLMKKSIEYMLVIK